MLLPRWFVLHSVLKRSLRECTQDTTSLFSYVINEGIVASSEMHFYITIKTTTVETGGITILTNPTADAMITIE
ncbi:hypothetical protein BOTCAL_0454g00030 [Botryotinia calthae]|uniref:Uncharacterized protein n=1 Tax=Botryotinia calthae TaxID=38488 RepID=A0A4Y8CPP3_9HELO|nr:hypothetical protein BOTCAL_0454g00030 [Botryotinia calthae]